MFEVQEEEENGEDTPQGDPPSFSQLAEMGMMDMRVDPEDCKIAFESIIMSHIQVGQSGK